MKKNYNYSRQSGIGLLEILISLLIGTILILAITTMYGNFIGASKLQQEQSTAQDQANFAFLELNRSVRMAGAGLCVKPTVDAATNTHQNTGFDTFPSIIPPNFGTKIKFSAALRLHSFSGATNSELGTSLTIPSDAGDVLFVIYSDADTRRVDGALGVARAEDTSRFNERKLANNRTSPSSSSNNNDPVFNYDNNGNLQTTWIMMSDCDHTGIFKYSPERFNGKAANVLPLPDSGNFAYNFGNAGQEVLIGKLHAKLYFVALDANNISQLYVKDLLASNTDARPLAAYISRMKIEYQDPSTNNWIDSASRSKRSNWNEEWPVRISLTANTGSQLEEQAFTRVLGIRN